MSPSCTTDRSIVIVAQNDLKRSGKSSADSSGDLPRMISQNARPPGPYAVPEVLLRYFSVGPDGTPLLTTITPDDVVDRTAFEDWSGNDYVDMPAELQQPSQDVATVYVM